MQHILKKDSLAFYDAPPLCNMVPVKVLAIESLTFDKKEDIMVDAIVIEACGCFCKGFIIHTNASHVVPYSAVNQITMHIAEYAVEPQKD